MDSRGAAEDAEISRELRDSVPLCEIFRYRTEAQGRREISNSGAPRLRVKLCVPIKSLTSEPGLRTAQHSVAALALETRAVTHDLHSTGLEKTSVGWFASHDTWLLAAPFALAAAAHLLPLEIFRAAGYPAGYRAVTGGLLALAALLMVLPEARLAGTFIAAFVMFLTATTLISRRQYTYAMPVVAALFALVPVTLAL